MTCGTCGASIADKAIICYRCGAATAAPAARSKATGRAASRAGVVVVGLVAAGLLAAGLLLPDESAVRLPMLGAGALAVVAAGVLWLRGRSKP